MATSGESVLPTRDLDSLSEFTRSVLQHVNVSCSDDSWSTNPKMCSSNENTYGDDQFDGIFYRTTAEETEVALKSKKISNDQELIRSDPTSCPQNQKANN